MAPSLQVLQPKNQEVQALLQVYARGLRHALQQVMQHQRSLQEAQWQPTICLPSVSEYLYSVGQPKEAPHNNAPEGTMRAHRKD